jgi:hypothetical protein
MPISELAIGLNLSPRRNIMAEAERVSSAIAALRIGAGPTPSTKPVRAAYAELASLAKHPPRPIALNPHGVNLEDRADHLNKVLSAPWSYLTTILDGTAQNIPGGLDLEQIRSTLQYVVVKHIAWRAA